MKRFLILFCLALAAPLTAQPAMPSLQPRYQQVLALAKQGHHREAADAGKALLASSPDAQLAATCLHLVLEQLRELDADAEEREVLEKTVRDFPKAWQVLLEAGLAWQMLPHIGPGTERLPWRWMPLTPRHHRVRGLQLLEAALLAQPAAVPPKERARVLRALEDALLTHSARRAWALQMLTDLSTLPDPEDEDPVAASQTAHPVDAAGKPVFFVEPESWQAAQSDGERLLWLLQARRALGADEAAAADLEQARLAQSWFGVQTLAERGGFFTSQPPDAEQQSGIAALHTLREDETTARLATGVQRFTLPAAWAFLPRLRARAEDAQTPAALRLEAWGEIAEELRHRRQYERAAEALRQAIALKPGRNQVKNLQEQLGQIAAPWASLEPQAPQPAGREARLSLLFRNAQRIRFSARPVDVAKLLDDTEAYLRSEPEQTDWERVQVGAIGQRLLAQGGDKYLGKVAARWEQELEPRAGHWDRRVEVPTPLQQAGAWLVEGTAEGGNTTRALLWLESLVIVQSRQAGHWQWFVADAASGAPVSQAKLQLFGRRQEWHHGTGRQRPRILHHFKSLQAVTDAQGQVVLPEADLDSYQWLVRATAAEDRLAFLAEGLQHFHHGQTFPQGLPTLYAITDRPVYRPGQEVKWKAWARQPGYDPQRDTNPFAGASLRVTIQTPRGEKLLEKTYQADAHGGIQDSLRLGDEATLGSYQLEYRWLRRGRDATHLGSHDFRVEEYKKPEFEVLVEAPKTPVALGDRFEVRVQADYYFGGAVKQGRVKYKVQRSAHSQPWLPAGPWDWLFGPGYGLRQQVYDWYPGAERWSFCMPVPPWWPRPVEPPELVAEGEAALDADGRFSIAVDTALAKELHGRQDHRYSIEAEVTDASRRTIVGNGHVLAARRPFEVDVHLDRGYYQAGASGEIRVHARSLDGRSVTARGQLRLMRVRYSADGRPTEEAVSSFEVTTGDEPVRQKVTWQRGGQYRVSALLKDAAGHEIEGSSFVTVRGEGFDNGQDFRFDDLELLVEKTEYAPGEDVEITLQTNRPGSTVALFLRPQDGVYPAPVWLRLDGKSATHRFKLTEADQPNVFIEAFTVSNARVHHATRQILVPPKQRIATVEVRPDARTYLPGQGAKVQLRVRDQDGLPFQGQVVLTAYDKALEYIAGSSGQTDIRSHFWGWTREHQPQFKDSLHPLETRLRKRHEAWMRPLGQFGTTADDSPDPRLAGMRMLSVQASSAEPEAAFAPPAIMQRKAGADMAAGASLDVAAPAAAEAGPQPMIRRQLADSAVWVADFTTDARGEGELRFNLPENLTTWQLRAWVMGPQTQVGEAAVEVITRKDLMVRLQAPRFFVEKDEAVISANVHNELDADQDVRAVLELEGGVLELLAPAAAAPPPQRIAAHGEHRFDWRVRVTGAGAATIRVKALAAKDSDAMEMTFPARIHGLLKTDAWSLALRPDQASGGWTLRVPAERKPAQSRLEVRWSPSLAMALVDALPYLADYPYGCTEQTLNRFVPTVLTLDVLKQLGVDLRTVRDKRANLNAQELGDPRQRAQRRQPGTHAAVFDEEEVRRMARAGLDRLAAMRNADGGWGWFPGGRTSLPHMTAVVVHGLKAAERAGLAVDDFLLQQAVGWLKAREAEQLRRLQLPAKAADHKSRPDDLDALIHSVLVECGAAAQAMRDRLFEQRLPLSRYNQALLGLACHAAGEAERRDVCLRNLKQFLRQDEENQTAWLELPDTGWWHWHQDRVETQAAFLRLLVAQEPEGELAARVAKHLLNQRRNGTYWNSTKDTAAVIEALAAFVKASGETEPEQTVELLLDGRPQKQVRITRDNLFDFDGRFVLEGEAVTTGEHRLELRKLGRAPLYANAWLTVFSQEEPIPAAGLEVRVKRAFHRLIEEKTDRKAAGAHGQVLNQQGLKYRREPIADDTLLKSGELVEVELTVESKNDCEYVLIEDPKPAGFEAVSVRSGWSDDGLPAYQEFRDEKVAFFAERLPKGIHQLRYRVKAEIPGRFSALPARVEAMYAPELQGNSAEWKARIGD